MNDISISILRIHGGTNQIKEIFYTSMVNLTIPNYILPLRIKQRISIYLLTNCTKKNQNGSKIRIHRVVTHSDTTIGVFPFNPSPPSFLTLFKYGVDTLGLDCTKTGFNPIFTSECNTTSLSSFSDQATFPLRGTKTTLG